MLDAYDCVKMVMSDDIDTDTFLQAFYLHPSDEQKLLNDYDADTLLNAAERTFNIILNAGVMHILDIITEHESEIPEITSYDIPCLSEVTDCDRIPEIVESNPGIKYKSIGYYFNKHGTEASWQKYGENHCKGAAQMHLITEDRPYRATYIGLAYMNKSFEEKDQIRPFLCLRIPIVQIMLINGRKGYYDGMDFLRSFLTEKTARRRRSSLLQMINQVYKAMPPEEAEYIKKNIDWDYNR